MIAIKTMKEMPKNCLECPAFDNCEDCEGYMNACGITNEQARGIEAKTYHMK